MISLFLEFAPRSFLLLIQRVAKLLLPLPLFAWESLVETAPEGSALARRSPCSFCGALKWLVGTNLIQRRNLTRS